MNQAASNASAVDPERERDRIIALSTETFGREKALKWLHRPTAALGGETPLSLLDTNDGARAVETLIGRIGHGIAG